MARAPAPPPPTPPPACPQGAGLEAVRTWVAGKLPESPSLYPRDIVSELPERFFVAEIIRKHIFMQYRQEVPYGVAGRLSWLFLCVRVLCVWFGGVCVCVRHWAWVVVSPGGAPAGGCRGRCPGCRKKGIGAAGAHRVTAPARWHRLQWM